MGSDSTKERSLGGVGGRRVIFLSGVAMLFQRGTVVAFQKSFRYLPSGFMVLSEHGAHIFGALAIAVSLVILFGSIFDLRGRSPAMKKPCRSHAGDEKLQ